MSPAQPSLVKFLFKGPLEIWANFYCENERRRNPSGRRSSTWETNGQALKGTLRHGRGMVSEEFDAANTLRSYLPAARRSPTLTYVGQFSG